MNFEPLKNESRLLIEVELKPVQGTRFQPTGFPDLGAATYQTPEGKQMLLLESAQSMANRLEAVCWDEGKSDLVPPLKGLPYISIKDKDGKTLTNSILESHRINSPYILESADKAFFSKLQGELGAMEIGRVDLQLLARTMMKYDPNTLIHGVFLAKKELAGGRLRIPRSLSSFVEASDINIVASGGVKMDSVNPKGDTGKGFGHVPFHRDEFSGKIKAFFSIDLAQIRGYRLGKEAEDMLIALSLFKVSKLLSTGLRFRTACDLQIHGEPVVIRPQGFKMPSLSELEGALPSLIQASSPQYASPRITEVLFKE
jgi:CRISPR-associated protein Csb1